MQLGITMRGFSIKTKRFALDINTFDMIFRAPLLGEVYIGPNIGLGRPLPFWGGYAITRDTPEKLQAIEDHWKVEQGTVRT